MQITLVKTLLPFTEGKDQMCYKCEVKLGL